MTNRFHYLPEQKLCSEAERTHSGFVSDFSNYNKQKQKMKNATFLLRKMNK